jgi:Methyltransferase FkbM domain
MNSVRPLSYLKNMLVRPGRRPRRIWAGLFRNLLLDIDLRSDTQLYFGLWERETYSYIRSSTLNCSWVIDVGAGRGELCVYCLKNSSADRVVAVEPTKNEVAIMRDNLFLNKCESERILIHCKYAGTRRGDKYVQLDELGIDYAKPGFVKIDVDGYELDVLRSGRTVFSAGNPMVLVETHSQKLEKDCSEWLSARGYHCQIIRPAWWRLFVPERRPIPHNRWLWAAKGTCHPAAWVGK